MSRPPIRPQPRLPNLSDDATQRAMQAVQGRLETLEATVNELLGGSSSSSSSSTGSVGALSGTCAATDIFLANSVTNLAGVVTTLEAEVGGSVTGSVDVTTQLQLNGLANVPARLTQSVNDWAPGGAGTWASTMWWYQDSDAGGIVVNGLTARPHGTVVVLVNTFTVGGVASPEQPTAAFFLQHNAASSAAGNRILTPSSGVFQTPTKCPVVMIYDGFTSPGFWRVIPPPKLSTS